MHPGVLVLAPAKLNLSLDIVGLLPNGYHDLDMVMQAVTLYERVEVRAARELSVRLPGSRLPADERNTAWKAAQAFFQYTGLLAGASITLHKAVPVRAGMAGGSADAAAVLVGLDRLYRAHLSMSELLMLGAGIGADVPFSLLGGTARVQGTGDLLRALPPCPECRFVIVMPRVGVSTPEAFRRYDSIGSAFHPNCDAQEEALRRGDLAGVCTAAGNALTEASGATETGAICQALKGAGALAALMTGSGAAVYGIFDSARAASAAAAALKERWRQVYVAQPDFGGARCVRRFETEA